MLLGARKLVADPVNWCQQNYAENADGYAVEVNDPTASRFCVLGAIYRATQEYAPDNGAKLALAAQDCVDRELAYRGSMQSIGFFNDATNREHREVIGLLDTTIGRVSRMR